jgi:hypothetical protein
MKRKVYKNAPLPFQGQKRRFAGTFSLILQELKAEKEVDVVVDLFGGSGLLSHIAKHVFPEAHVIYNDFDNYTIRLKNIDRTNSLLAEIRQYVSGIPREQKLSSVIKNKIITCIEDAERKGFVDYITLSASLLFSSKYAVSLSELKKEPFCNRVRNSDYEIDSSGYLYGLDIVCSDYKDLYNTYKDSGNVLFIIDPPYLSTDTTTYGSNKYWKLRDYLDVLSILADTNYIFFSSNKSSLIELCEWFSDNRDIGNPFKNSVLRTQNVRLNKTAGYTDLMLYKFLKGK